MKHYREDYSTIRNENTHENMNMFRKVALKMLKNYIEVAKPKRKAIVASMRGCMLSNDYLESVLNLATV